MRKPIQLDVDRIEVDPLPLFYDADPLCEVALAAVTVSKYRNEFKTHCDNVFTEGQA